VKIPILIENLCTKQIFPQDTSVLIRNFFDLNVKPVELTVNISPNGIVESEIEIVSNRLTDYEIEVFLFHPNIVFEQESLILKIKVNDDLEEEELNEYFINLNSPKLIVLSKEKKSILKKVKEEGLSEKKFEVTLNILDKYNWLIESALDELLFDDEKEDYNFV
jgi:hypothetical protein